MNRKDANIWPEYPARKWMGKLQNYREAQILFAGIELDIFSLMENPVSAGDGIRETADCFSMR